MGLRLPPPATWWCPILWRIGSLFQEDKAGDFQSGESASNVFGQPDFSSSLAGVLAGPHLISLDSSDQLYVADTGNNRIAVLPSVPMAGNNPAVLFSIAGLSNPYGVFVDPVERRNLGRQYAAEIRYCNMPAGFRSSRTRRPARP